MSLLDPKPKTPIVIVGVEFSGTKKPYYYRAPVDMGIEPGDRVITPRAESFSIPTVVGVYPADCSMAKEADDWIVQKIDTTRRDALRREYALG